MVANQPKNKIFDKQVPTQKVGLGLRQNFIKKIIQNPKEISQKIGWLEAHSENHYANGGPAIKALEKIRQDFPISLHSVGNSLGSASGLDLDHLQKLKNLINIIEPFLVSDHISWGRVENNHMNDLLPIPYNSEALKIICKNIEIMQDFLQREILVENPSAYISFQNDEMKEDEFINQITQKTGCKLLLDINNIFVSSHNNLSFDPEQYLQNIDQSSVAEIHLAGHFKSNIYSKSLNRNLLIDTHNDVVCDEVWNLYKIANRKFLNIPTLIEWDQDFPEFNILLDEVEKAKNIAKTS